MSKIKTLCIEFNKNILIDTMNQLSIDGLIEPILCTTNHGEEEKVRSVVSNQCIVINNKVAARSCGDFFNKFNNIDKIDNEIYDKHGDIFINTLDMMDKSEFIDGQFHYNERRRQVSRLLNIWNGILSELKPDAIIFSETPHSTYSYILYRLAQLKKIKILIFDQVAVDMRLIAVDSIDSISTYFANNIQYVDTTKELSPSFAKKIENMKLSYDVGMPYYMVNQLKSNKKNIVNLIYLELKNRISNLMRIINLLQSEKDYLFNSSLKVDNKSNICQAPSLIMKSYYSIKQFVTIINNKKWYKNNTKKVLPNKPYIYFPLHFQPEMTSTPRGGYYSDQLLILDHLVSLVKDTDIRIVVKEHQTQFVTSFGTNPPRNRDFYKKILQYEEVNLIDTTIDSFTCIKNSEIIATITGTAGFEGLVNEKKVIYYGTPWYGNFPNTFYGPDLKNIIEVKEKELIFDLSLYYKVIDQFSSISNIREDDTGDGVTDLNSDAIYDIVKKWIKI